MKKEKHIPDEFYIGYLPRAPRRLVRAVRAVTAAAVLLSLTVCLLLALNQRKFSTGVFEYGVLTDVEGILLLEPVPNLRVPGNGDDGTHTLLLVGPGKSGALPVIRRLERMTGRPLNGQRVVLKGTRIYGHGKGLLQITAEDNTLLPVLAPAPHAPPVHAPAAYQKLYGEVTDPKCYFGVMKPGEGKPHRSCAVRCIAGGIPPVFATRRNGVAEYVVLTGEGVADAIIAYAGEPLQLEGLITTYYDWKIMKVDTKKIQTLATRRQAPARPVQDDGITLCSGL